jgi:hypothetical protein
MIPFGIVCIVVGVILFVLALPRNHAKIEVEAGSIKANLPEITGWVRFFVFILGLIFISLGLAIGVTEFMHSVTIANANQVTPTLTQVAKALDTPAPQLTYTLSPTFTTYPTPTSHPTDTQTATSIPPTYTPYPTYTPLATQIAISETASLTPRPTNIVVKIGKTIENRCGNFFLTFESVEIVPNEKIQLRLSFRNAGIEDHFAGFIKGESYAYDEEGNEYRVIAVGGYGDDGDPFVNKTVKGGLKLDNVLIDFQGTERKIKTMSFKLASYGFCYFTLGSLPTLSVISVPIPK